MGTWGPHRVVAVFIDEMFSDSYFNSHFVRDGFATLETGSAHNSHAQGIDWVVTFGSSAVTCSSTTVNLQKPHEKIIYIESRRAIRKATFSGLIGVNRNYPPACRASIDILRHTSTPPPQNARPDRRPRQALGVGVILFYPRHWSAGIPRGGGEQQVLQAPVLGLIAMATKLPDHAALERFALGGKLNSKGTL